MERSEFEQIFADRKKAHKDCMRMNNSLLILGPIASVLCGAIGVRYAFQNKPLVAFIEIFLCLYDAVVTYEAIVRRSRMKKDWLEFEACHRLLMECLDKRAESEA